MRLTLLAALLLLSTNLIDLKAQTLQEQLGNLATIIVDTSGKGNYTKLQDAINAVPDYSSQRTIIYLRNGIYHEKIDVPESKQNLTLVGENMDSTVISWDDYSGKVVDGVELGTSTSHTMIVSSTDFYAFNLTIQNTAGDVGQAVALNTKGDRQTFVHCKLLGYQDTYYVKGYGRFYLKDCYIEGATDYIFGRGVALFDSCQIHSVKSKSYITAASTPQDWKYGYVFQNCKLTANSDLSRVHLGRPWRPYCQVVYMYCEMGKYINPVGWHNWGKPEREESTFYAEYKCFGPGADTSNRVSWSQQLTDEQASQYTLPAIFAKDVNPSPFSSDWDPNLSNHPIYQLIERNTIKFLDPRNANARLSSIQYNQLILQNFHPDTLSYERLYSKKG